MQTAANHMPSGPESSQPASSYGDALRYARQQVADGQSVKYICDGHSYVYLQNNDQSVVELYDGPSTIALPDLPRAQDRRQA